MEPLLLIAEKYTRSRNAAIDITSRDSFLPLRMPLAWPASSSSTRSSPAVCNVTGRGYVGNCRRDINAETAIGAAPDVKPSGLWGRYRARYFGKNPSGARKFHPRGRSAVDVDIEAVNSSPPPPRWNDLGMLAPHMSP